MNEDDPRGFHTTLTDRRVEDRRGKGKPVGMFEAQWLSVNADRRQGERRA